MTTDCYDEIQNIIRDDIRKVNTICGRTNALEEQPAIILWSETESLYYNVYFSSAHSVTNK